MKAKALLGVLVGSCLTQLLLLAQTNAPPAKPNTSAPAIGDAVKETGVSGSHLTEAVMLYRNGRFDEAAQRYQQLLETQPRSAEVSAGLARVYLKQKKLQQARETLSKGLMSADTAVIHVALGEILFREGKPPEAEGKKGDR